MHTDIVPGARFAAEIITKFATELFETAGMTTPMAAVTARHLVEGDLLGHVTHGLQLCPAYLGDLETGKLTRSGEIETVSAKGAVATWDGRYLSGPWVVERAIAEASRLAESFGTGTIAIRRCHHIGALAAFLEGPSRAGLVIEISCVDPAMATVAPHGGIDAVFTPDPLAVGIPTDGDPILIDLSSSITANGVAAKYRREGRLLPGPWLQDAEGRPGDDPNILYADPPGTLLPTGGLDHGHKGFAMALILETLTQGLSGEGRADGVSRWGAAVTVRVTDPAAFCGVADFKRQSQWIVDRCLQSRPRPEGDGVRMPGQRGLAHKRHALENGLSLNVSIMDGLREWAGKLGVPLPNSMD